MARLLEIWDALTHDIPMSTGVRDWRRSFGANAQAGLGKNGAGVVVVRTDKRGDPAGERAIANGPPNSSHEDSKPNANQARQGF